MDKIIGAIFAAFGFFALFIIIVGLFGYAISAIWNLTLAVAIAGVSQIDWYQGMGIYFLAGIFSTVHGYTRQIK